MQFSPDFVIVGFCMNDATEPLVVDTRRGGPGLDYHLVSRLNSRWLDFVMNDTGLGLVASLLRLWMVRDDLESRWRKYGVARMIEGSHDDPEFIAAWDGALRDLDEIYTLARQANLPVVFPEGFQLENETLQEPQKILLRHAESRGVNRLDITEVAERYLAESGSVSDLFLDSNHYSVRGHEMIAYELLRQLELGSLGGAVAFDFQNSASVPPTTEDH